MTQAKIDLSHIPFLEERNALLIRNAEYVVASKAVAAARAAVPEGNNEDEDAAVVAASDALDAIAISINDELKKLYPSRLVHPWTLASSEADDAHDYFELCLFTGLPIHDDDGKLWDDEVTGGFVIRDAVLGRHPDAIEQPASVAA